MGRSAELVLVMADHVVAFNICTSGISVGGGHLVEYLYTGHVPEHADFPSLHVSFAVSLGGCCAPDHGGEGAGSGQGLMFK